MCRCFENPEVVHVDDGPIDPVRDLQVLENELLLADLQSCEKRVGKDKKANSAEAILLANLLKKAKEVLDDGKPARILEPTLTKEEKLVWHKLQLLTQKPILYCANVGEEDLRKGGNAMTKALFDFLKEQLMHSSAGKMDDAAATAAAENRMLVVSAQLEAEAALLSDEDRASFLQEYGLQQTGVDAVTQKAAKLLNLQAYFTTGPMETRAWCIPIGATAVEAAAAIHTEISTGFIKADVIAFNDVVAVGGEKQAKEKNLVKSVGKDYIVQDGDVMHFKHNTTSAGGKR
jgi:ribosome-binding ATPase